MKSQRIKQLTDTLVINSLYQWIELLNFAEKNKDLTLDELRQLADASEQHRKYWNEPMTTQVAVVKNGQEILTPTTRSSLDIAQEDVSFNIHRRIEELELELERISRENIKPKTII